MNAFKSLQRQHRFRESTNSLSFFGPAEPLQSLCRASAEPLQNLCRDLVGSEQPPYKEICRAPLLAAAAAEAEAEAPGILT